MTNFQLIILMPFLIIVRQENGDEFINFSPVENKSKVLQVYRIPHETDKQEDRLSIPEFEDFRQFLETSGVVPQADWHKYPIESETGFYGFYTLFTKEKKYLGELIVHFQRSINYWKMDDPNQTFIRMIIDGDGIEVIKGLKIGITREELYKLLGNPLYKLQDCVIYRDIRDTLVKVKLKDEKVITIDYGLYSKTYLDSIDWRRDGCK